MATVPDGAHGARVPVPPPVYYLAAFGAGWLADRAARWPVPDGAWSGAGGGVLLGAGCVVLVAGAGTILAHRTTVIPHRPVSRLVEAGPFRFSRNPMYVGMTLAYAGAALLVGSWWPLLALPVAVIAVDRLAIAREEVYLTDRFGADYEAYRARVRRWV